MDKHGRHPQWWLLYALLPPALGSLVWAHRLGLTAPAETIIQLVILAVVFALVGFWLNANAAALVLEAVPGRAGTERAPLGGGEPQPSQAQSRPALTDQMLN